MLKKYQICEKNIKKYIDKELTNGYTKTIENKQKLTGG